MTIWKWPLYKTILDGHSLKAFVEFYDENYISYVEEEGEIGVNKKQYTFHKRKWKLSNMEVSMSRIDKLLSKESIHNVPFKVTQRDTKKGIHFQGLIIVCYILATQLLFVATIFMVQVVGHTYL